MSEISQAISQGTFASFREQTRSDWAKGDIAPR
jgi:queuine tRNA-ribosyltransferase